MTTAIIDRDEIRKVFLQGNKIVAVGTASGNLAIARYSTDGTLDQTFANNGIVVSGYGAQYVRSALLQGDKTVIAGSIGGQDALVRYTANGALDQSFGQNGRVITNTQVLSVRLDDNKILAAGSTGEYTLVRYSADGAPDQSFGENGLATGYFPSTNSSISAAVVQGKKIVVAGTSGSDFGLARTSDNGILDSSFGVNGIMTTDFGSSLDNIQSVLLQSDKIIAVGRASESFGLARYMASGILDSSFGVNGTVTINKNYMFDVSRSALLQGNKIIVAGEAYGNFALFRYTADGLPDSSFGVNGIAITDVGGIDGAVTILFQGDKIVAAGNSKINVIPNSFIVRFALVRYTADGVLDKKFGSDGKVTTLVANNSHNLASAILQGAKIIVAGAVNNHFTLVRYTPDGALDKTFGINGVATAFDDSSPATAEALVLQGDKIIAAGESYNGNMYDLALARYTVNGLPDSSFSEDGIQKINLSGSCSVGGLILQDNRLITVGRLGLDNEAIGFMAAFQLEKPAGLQSVSSSPWSMHQLTRMYKLSTMAIC